MSGSLFFSGCTLFSTDPVDAPIVISPSHVDEQNDKQEEEEKTILDPLKEKIRDTLRKFQNTTGDATGLDNLSGEVLLELLEVLEKEETERNILIEEQIFSGEVVREKEMPKEQIVYRHTTGDPDAYDQFPVSVEERDFIFSNIGKKPKANNVSYIYLDKSANSDRDRIFEDGYSLAGLIVDNVEFIEVIWDSDKEPYLLTNFQPGEKEFVYNIQTSYGNLQPGINTYLIRGYAYDAIYERVFVLSYYPYDDSVRYFNLVDEEDLFSYDEYSTACQSPVYTVDEGGGYDEYYLEPANNWSYIQTLEIPGYTIEYQNIPSTETYSMEGRMRIAKKFVDANTIYTPWVSTFMRCGDFGGYRIKVYDDEYVVFIPSSGHEGNAVELLYLREKNKIYNIVDDILVPLFGGAAYGLFSVTLENDQLILDEHRYCCDSVMNDGGHERLAFSLPDLTLISKTPLEKRYAGLDKDTYEYLNIPVGALQSEKDFFVREITSNGAAHITLLGEEYDWVRFGEYFSGLPSEFAGVTNIEALLAHPLFDYMRLGIEGGIWSARYAEYATDDANRLVIEKILYK